jgi:chaperonin cofactor prefoldin
MSDLVEGIETLNMTRSQLLKDYGEIIDDQRQEISRLKNQNAAMLREFKEIEQILGKALHFPWFKDDPVNFPNATEKDGVVVAGPTWELAMHTADKIKKLEDNLETQIERLKDNIEVLEDELASRDA